ncbi:MAG TPA: NAD+ synthase, partial [Bacteroidales bacterium]|nr:NAD+ synthase [Bacteroidales bacterium]
KQLKYKFKETKILDMQIALAQLNYIVGDISGNSQLILKQIEKATANGTDLIVFSELSICGYPPLDLLERRAFVESSLAAIEDIATLVPEELGVIIGGPEINSEDEGKLLYNSAFFLNNGKIKNVFRKSLLPTYDIFDEYRYFEPNKDFSILKFKNKKIAVTICEDLWDDQPDEKEFSRSRLYKIHPLEEMMAHGPEAVINIAASPFSAGKHNIKKQIFTDKAKKHALPVIMVNQIGANTELIFEGGSFIASPDGNIYHQLALFENDYYEFDLDDIKSNKNQIIKNNYDRIALIHDALVLGIRDYFIKSGFNKATLGLSGGIDSAVTLALAEKALGNEKIHVLLMPSQYSSNHSIEDSVLMADNLGIKYSIIAIEDIFNLYKDALTPIFQNLPEGTAEENIQSRIRGTLLMALSNKLGNILLNTSNKSETAVGYGTLYGDMAGGLSALGDVYKNDVYKLAKHINLEKEIIPQNIIAKPPSAELKPDQKDSDSLPDYDTLDEILDLYIEKQIVSDQIIEMGYDKTIVNKITRLVNINEYKRYQTPPILRISSKAFGIGRRIPIVGKY